MKLYDSLTNQAQDLDNEVVNIYSCGPTVYNHIHLGNARPVILMDILTRYLISEGQKPRWVQNITDIDDKIIDVALKNKKSEKEIANFYFQSYLEDLKALNVNLPQAMPLISDYLPQMINYIQSLIDSGNAYQSGGDVFFDVSKNKAHYGLLSKQRLNQLKETSSSAKKKSAWDFALWKHTNIGKKWDSPWGPGRPGWHTECVVLVNEHFKNQPLDIHAGGIDLQFPHHENERAQHLALTGKELARTWLHNGHLTFNDEKMSKTSGNMVLVKDFVAKYEPDLLRWIFLTTHYRRPVNFSEDLLEQGNKFFKKLSNLRKKMIYQVQSKNSQTLVMRPISSENLNKFRKAMNDNLNTAQVLSLLESIISEANHNLSKQDYHRAHQNYSDLDYLLKTLGFRNHLSLALSNQERQLYQKWLRARDTKDFAKADKYRQQLKKKDLL